MLDSISILTPEKAIVSQRIAGFWTRLWAHVIDLVVLIVLYIGLSRTAGLLSLAVGEAAVSALAMMLAAILQGGRGALDGFVSACLRRTARRR